MKYFCKNNFLHRLAQDRDRRIQDGILKQFAAFKELKEQLSTIDVSMVKVAPILAVLAAGYSISFHSNKC